MRVEQHERLSAPLVLTAILDEFSAVSDYRTLQDSLPRRLAHLLRSRHVLFYKRVGDTLQFVSGTFEDQPGWSTSLLAVAQINPIDLNSERPEARAWRLHRAATAPADSPRPHLVAVPLLYRQRAIGVLVAIREGACESAGYAREAVEQTMLSAAAEAYWTEEEIRVVEAVAGVSAMLLENTLLLERDRERIHELSLLNSIASQMNSAIHDLERLCAIIMQRSREIAPLDLCEVLLPPPASSHARWIPPALSAALFRYAREQGLRPAPLIIERPGSPQTADYVSYLPAAVSTFIALPLVSGGDGGRRGRLNGGMQEAEPRILGIIAGASYHPWKIRHVELMMLQVLASQASAALENIHLMTEVIEARNEARKLLRQVLDDQRLKELILESIPSGLMTIDLQGQITTFNRAAAMILGYHPYEALGQPVQKILPLQNPHGLLERARTHLHGETLLTRDRQGEDVVLDLTLLPLCNDRGEQIGTLVTFSDVTSVHRLQEEKRRLDELASLGKMAASVAHEVRNPLASIKITMQMLMDDLEKALAREREERSTAGTSLEEHRSAQESIAVVLKEVERLDNIVRDLLLFAKPRQLHRVPCDLIALNEHVLQALQPCLSEAGIIVHRVYQSELLQQREQATILADMEQMEQVLFNLYMNAIQAMPEGGILTSGLRMVQTTRPAYALPTAASAGPPAGVSEGRSALPEQPASRQGGPGPRAQTYSQDWLELSVSDTGIGIPPEQLDVIFQPFFTTKAHGIGLGLSITQRLVESHQGQITVESRLGYGATFTIRLPRAPTAAEPEEG